MGGIGVGWKLLILLCVALMLVVSFARRQAQSLRLYAQAADFVIGRAPSTSALGRLKGVIPAPAGWELIGVSRAGTTPTDAVVGLAARGGLDEVAHAYVEAMESAGWTLVGVSQGVGIVTFRRPSPPRRACVMFRPTDQQSVTVVVQVAP